MTTKTKRVLDRAGNPFSDSQARNYSDTRVVYEFCPISQFWSLFNDQHEVIIGARGCGKTILLKMMRYSMLRNIPDLRANKLVLDKKYIAFYVPLHLEFIKRLSTSPMLDDQKIIWFRFSFNCALAQSIILEISEMLKDLYDNELLRAKTEYEITQAINEIWKLDTKTEIHQFWKIREAVSKLYYGVDPLHSDASLIPTSFTHSLGSSLSSISNCLCNMFNISPTWILCVDEAEFLEECYQRCINTAFRADSNRIAIKMATLPYYHTTQKTLDDHIEVMNGQDFKYTIVDMKYDDSDFINVTNSIVSTRFATEGIEMRTLDSFVQTIGDDCYLDYYSREMGKEKSQSQYMQKQIISQLSEGSQKHNAGKTEAELRKPVFNKLAPIFYLREIYKKRTGHYIPGWYAGASMVRRIAQGNPRIFIRIMNDLYNKADGQRLPLGLKQQNQTIEVFAKSFCRETETLESVGRIAQQNLEYIANIMQKRTHEGKLTQTGLSFKFNNDDLLKHKVWLQKCVAFSRLFVDSDSLIMGLTKDSKFELSNLYAVSHWLPMRSSTPIQIAFPTEFTEKISKLKKNKQKDNPNKSVIPGQLSLLTNEEESHAD